MKKTLYFCLLLSLFAASCGKDSDPEPDPNGGSYMNAKAGSTWNYEVINNVPPASTQNYTLTSSNRDSSINGRNYHVYSNNRTGGSEYYFVSGSDHYTFGSLPATVGTNINVENIYLKSGADVGTTWAQSYNVPVPGFPFPINVTVTHKIEEKGITKVINNITYNNVIHVSTLVTAAGIPPSALTTDIDMFYAPNVGVIERNVIITSTLAGNSNSTTRLKTSALVP
jgi:hypothetical protein